MSNLVKAIEIKTVKFNGVDLIGIKGSDGNIYTSVKKICDDLGVLTHGQIAKIKNNSVFDNGTQMICLPTKNNPQETFCLDVDMLPFWLAGINPKKVRDNIKPYLVEFQLKVVQILKNAFINHEGMKQETINISLPTNYIQALEALLESEKQKQVLLLESEETNKKLALIEPKARAYDSFMSSSNSLDFSAVAKSFGMGRNKLFEYCRNKKLLMGNNQPYQEYIDSEYFEVITINIQKSDALFNTTKTLITPKGQSYIWNLLQKDKQVSFLKKVS